VNARVIPIRPTPPTEDPAAVILTESRQVQAAAQRAPLPPLDLDRLAADRDRLAGDRHEATTRALALLDVLVEYLHAQPCVELDSGATFAVVPLRNAKEAP
jgi:hypothetical protein